MVIWLPSQLTAEQSKDKKGAAQFKVPLSVAPTTSAAAPCSFSTRSGESAQLPSPVNNTWAASLGQRPQAPHLPGLAPPSPPRPTATSPGLTFRVLLAAHGPSPPDALVGLQA